MNLRNFIAIVLAGVLVGCTSSPRRATGAAGAPVHSFGIYLVDVPADKPWSPATLGHLAALPLAKEPVLSDADLLSYDFAAHTMLVKPGALARLPKPPVWHTPFVVVADGQRIYLGAFGTMASSQSVSVPTILVDFQGLTNLLTIDRAYPGPDFADGPDPRPDKRIRAALAGLQKTKQ